MSIQRRMLPAARRRSLAFLLLSFAALQILPAQPMSGGPASPPESQAPGAASVTLRGQIRNGTRGGGARVKNLSVLDPTRGMSAIAAQQDAGPNFVFANLPAPRGPYLLRAEFEGEGYSLFLPPTPQSYQQPQQLVVYESGAPAEQVFVTAAMRVTKTNRGLRVDLIHVIANQSQPPRSYDARNFQIYIPAEVSELQGGLQYSGSPMPLPLRLQAPAEGGRIKLQRMFRPGDSQLIVSFLIEAESFEDQLPLDPGRPTTPHAFRVVFFEPADARPEVSGALSVHSEQAPGLGEALRVVYQQGKSVHYDFSRGTALFEGGGEATNPIFSDWKRATLGVLTALLTLLLLVAVTAAIGARRRRDA
ncbi:MAG: hypothetical protein K1X75_02255 [Leptospirales bacterium]|nr:hypothetical protein [Leptospirales bacterium]